MPACTPRLCPARWVPQAFVGLPLVGMTYLTSAVMAEHPMRVFLESQGFLVDGNASPFFILQVGV